MIITNFGLIRKYKGYGNFIDIIEKLGIDHTGLIVGYCKDKKLLKELEEKTNDKNIHIINKYLTDKEIDFFFNISDIILMTYKESSTSGVYLLSCKYGKPFITYNYVGFKEIIKHGYNGYLFKNNKEIIDFIKKVDKKELKNVGKQCREYAQKNFNWSNLIDDIYQTYIEVLKK